MEKNFDPRALLAGMYDFGTGQACGASYISANKVCRVGAGDAPEAKTGRVSSAGASLADGLSDRVVSEMGVSREEIATAYDLYSQRSQEMAERLMAGKVSKEEMDEYMVKHTDFDLANSEFVFVGMENGLAPDSGMEVAPNAPSSGLATLAKMMAADKMVADGEASALQVQSAVHAKEVQEYEGVRFRRNQYIGVATDVAANATTSGQLTEYTGDGTSFFTGTKIATIEMNAFAANTVGYGGTNAKGEATPVKQTRTNKLTGKKEVVKVESSMDPNRSQYGALYNGQAGDHLRGITRNYNEKEIAARRSQYLGEELKRVAAGDKFKGGMAAPGGKSSTNYKNFRANMMDPLARSGTPVYETKMSFTAGKTTREHTIHVMELQPGKYFVLGDFTLNTFGYGDNRHHITAYREAVSRVRNGTAKRYTPPEPKARKASVKSDASKTSSSRQKANRAEAEAKKAAASTKKERGKLERKITKAREEKAKLNAQIRQRTSGKPTKGQQDKLSLLATTIRQNEIELEKLG